MLCFSRLVLEKNHKSKKTTLHSPTDYGRSQICTLHRDRRSRHCPRALHNRCYLAYRETADFHETFLKSSIGGRVCNTAATPAMATVFAGCVSWADFLGKVILNFRDTTCSRASRSGLEAEAIGISASLSHDWARLSRVQKTRGYGGRRTGERHCCRCEELRKSWEGS